jgi:hypothetical protein
LFRLSTRQDFKANGFSDACSNKPSDACSDRNSDARSDSHCDTTSDSCSNTFYNAVVDVGADTRFVTRVSVAVVFSSKLILWKNLFNAIHAELSFLRLTARATKEK